MKITKQDKEKILSFFDRCSFSTNDEINEENFDIYIEDNFPKGELQWSSCGISKAVFSFVSFPNLVVKVPFNCSESGEPEYRDTMDSYGNWTCVPNSNSCSYFSHFNSTRYSLPQELQSKVSREWDYCEVETILFRHAQKSAVESFFAETVFIGYISGTDYPVYVQELARIYDDVGDIDEDRRGAVLTDTNNRDAIYREFKYPVRDIVTDYFKQRGNEELCWYFIDLPDDWAIDCYLYYSLEELYALCSFLRKAGISDLHHENVGYINHRPIITDYASFNG